MRRFGTISRGVRAPIIKEGDNLVDIVVDSVLTASNDEGVEFRDKDIVCITESLVARAQGNYATVDQIATDVRRQFNGEEIGIVFPILSRNRFSMLLKGIAKGTSKVYLQLSYPNDEVGNPVIDIEKLYGANVNPYTDVLTIKQFREIFGDDTKHPFTGVDYIDFYSKFVDNIEIILANNPTAILSYTKNVIAADIHTRKRTKRMLESAGAKKVICLDDILNSSVDGSGYNEQYGLLGTNTAGDDKVKLFPRDGINFVNSVQAKLHEKTGKDIEVMIYGDGAFKDPVAGIWELADPVVSPAYTSGLGGQPTELKLKYIADNSGLSDEQIIEKIKNKNVTGNEALGTTPRNITDLVGSLCDLTSGSGDKGTPIIWIQGYFDNLSSK